MKVIKISDKSYEVIKKKAEKDRRTMIATVDIIIEKMKK